MVASDHFNDADGTLPGHGGGIGWSGSEAAKDGSAVLHTTTGDSPLGKGFRTLAAPMA